MYRSPFGEDGGVNLFLFNLEEGGGKVLFSQLRFV